MALQVEKQGQIIDDIELNVIEAKQNITDGEQKLI